MLERIIKLTKIMVFTSWLFPYQAITSTEAEEVKYYFTMESREKKHEYLVGSATTEKMKRLYEKASNKESFISPDIFRWLVDGKISNYEATLFGMTDDGYLFVNVINPDKEEWFFYRPMVLYEQKNMADVLGIHWTDKFKDIMENDGLRGLK